MSAGDYTKIALPAHGAAQWDVVTSLTCQQRLGRPEYPGRPFLPFAQEGDDQR